MNLMTLSPSTDRHAVAGRESIDGLLAWLQRAALPLWIERGVDWREGGVHEKLSLDGLPIAAPRRTRVVARQLYVFSTAHRLGWHADGERAAGHALQFLTGRLQQPDGTFAAAVEPDGTVVSDAFDLYEQAFALFGLAHAHRAGLGTGTLQSLALGLVGVLRRDFGHPAGGFYCDRAHGAPLLSNPHMHLLEACLAWAEAHDASEVWLELADEIVALCLQRLIDGRTGAVREVFDSRWAAATSVPDDRVEPGHQFEWAWLLRRWADLRPAEAAGIDRVAKTLALLGERHGIDVAHGVAVNALAGDLHLLDGHAKLWPQTERLKYWCDDIRRASAPGQRDWAKVALSGSALQRFLVVDPPGLWREVLQPDGRFVREPCRASSLYHIVGALETAHDLQRAAGGVPAGFDSRNPHGRH